MEFVALGPEGDKPQASLGLFTLPRRKGIAAGF